MSVDKFIEKQSMWEVALTKFRKILLSTELEENIKWGAPVYSLKGKNVVGMGVFKSYVGLWFFQGAFLKDPKNVLINAQDGKTKAQRQLRFTSEDDIDYGVVKAYILEAIQNQKAGKEFKPDLKKLIIIPLEMQSALDNDADLKNAFDTFTPGKKREFAEYISDARQEATRLKRLEKIIPMIKDGLGLNDKYRK
jgi:uncharacterized protein YdeI (YjbR/CyaY-like superfamily)